MKKEPDEAYQLIDEMATNSFQWQTADRFTPKRKETVVAAYHAEGSNPLEQKIDALSKQMETLMKAQEHSWKPPAASECDHCGSISHESSICPVGEHWAKHQEEANYVGNNNYNSGWRNNPNSSSWGNRQGGQSSNVYRPPHMQNQNQGPKPERKDPPNFQSNFQETMILFVHNLKKRISKLKNQVEQ